MASTPTYTDQRDLFDRRYRITIGNNSMVITDFQVTFTVRRTLKPKTPNHAEINIYNLNAQHRKELQAQRDVDVAIEAGYRSGISLIYRGQLEEAWSARAGNDWVTTISTQDKGKARRQTRVNKAHPPGTSLQTAIFGLAESLGYGLGNLQGKPLKIAATGATATHSGLALSGNAHDNLDRLLASAGLQWSVQDGAIQVLRLGEATTDGAIHLSQSSGLVDSPELGKEQTVKATALMIPGLYPGRLVELDSRYVSGLYRIDTAEYRGDYNSQNTWIVELELTAKKSST